MEIRFVGYLGPKTFSVILRLFCCGPTTLSRKDTCTDLMRSRTGGIGKTWGGFQGRLTKTEGRAMTPWPSRWHSWATESSSVVVTPAQTWHSPKLLALKGSRRPCGIHSASRAIDACDRAVTPRALSWHLRSTKPFSVVVPPAQT